MKWNPNMKSSFIPQEDRKKLLDFFLETNGEVIDLSLTREMLKPYFDLVLNVLDTNQVATLVGAVSEYILITNYGWKKNGEIGMKKDMMLQMKKEKSMKLNQCLMKLKPIMLPMIIYQKEVNMIF